MFKYIGDILDKFTVGQRIIALLLILFFGSLMYLGPNLINSLSTDTDLLTNKVRILEEEITSLQSQVSQQSSTIRNQSIECTNRILDREAEFIEMISQLEMAVMESKFKKTNLDRYSYMVYPPSPTYGDTIQYVDENTEVEDMVISKLDLIKSKFNSVK